MNDTLNITQSQEKDKIWEEKSYIEPEKNCLNNNVPEATDITTNTKSELIKKECGNIILQNEYYVYIIKHPITNKVFYVGKGKGRRWQYHLYYIKSNDRPKKGYNSFYLFNKIKKMLREGIIPVVEKIFENLSETEALSKEIETIKYYGRENLCNLTNGGDGISGYKFSIEARRKIADNLRGHKMSEKTRIALRNVNVGRKMKPEWVLKQTFMASNKTYYIKNHNTNENHITRNLRKFCKIYNLKPNTMKQTFDRKRKALSGACAGWELYDILSDIPII